MLPLRHPEVYSEVKKALKEITSLRDKPEPPELVAAREKWQAAAGAAIDATAAGATGASSSAAGAEASPAAGTPAAKAAVRVKRARTAAAAGEEPPATGEGTQTASFLNLFEDEALGD